MNYKNFDFVSYRKLCFIFSITLTIIGIIALSVFGFNLGIEFKSGSSLDIQLQKVISQEQAVEIYEQAGFTVQPTIGNDGFRVSNRFEEVLGDEERIRIVEAFTAFNGETVEYEENTVDAGMASEFAIKSIWVVLIATFGISIYVLIRFEWRFAIAAIISLLHVAFLVISVFAIFRLEVSLTFIAAVLTIIGYSINDTVVIFDRIRENLRFAKLKKFEDVAQLVNQSLRQTFIRSVNTGITVIFVVICLLILGSEAIRLFSLAMLIGLLFGIYSSLFIAAPLWLELKGKTLKPSRKGAGPAAS